MSGQHSFQEEGSRGLLQVQAMLFSSDFIVQQIYVKSCTLQNSQNFPEIPSLNTPEY